MIKFNVRNFAGVLLAVAALSVPARANILTLTLEQATQTVAPGDTVTFVGDFSVSGTDPGDTFINADDFADLTGLVYVGSIDYNPSDPTQVVVDDTDFVLSTPFCMNPTGTPTDSADCNGSAPASTSMDLFTITAGLNAAPGPYTGTFEILGGSSLSDSGPLASQDFTLDVTAQEGSATPEPGTLWLLLPAAVLPVWRRVRK